VTIAGPHFRDGGTFVRLRLHALNRPIEDPLYSFAFITDTHVRLTGREDWMNRKMGEATAAELARTLDDLAREGIAFVIHGGDMTDTATRAEFGVVRDVLGSQPLPVYGCIGNHDRYLPASRDDARELLASHFPGGELDYTFTRGPLRFVVLDVEIEEAKARTRQLQRLEALLHSDTDTPTLFVWHYPVFNRGTRSTSGFRLQDWSQLGRDVLLQPLVAAPNVFACINGHDHWDEVNSQSGLPFVQNAAFVEWPNSYRVYRVYRDRLEWEVRQVRNRGFIRESFLPDKAMSWMIATGETDLSGSMPFVRRRL
jgi:predicted MPP superfamily phosphohydrolase